MVRIFFTLFIIHYLLSTSLSAASVKAELAETEVVQGNMAQLRITATGNRAAFPDIKDIAGVEVVAKSQGQSNSITSINGKVINKHKTTLVLTFEPKQDMIVPSYNINIDGKVYKTNPIELKVIKSNAPLVSSSDRFALLIRSDKEKIMLGESFVVTVYFSLQNGIRLSDQPKYTRPKFKGFFVKELEQKQSYSKGNRSITELKYILTPKKEGNYTIEAATAKVGVADTSRQDIFGRFFGTIWTEITSNTIDIEVKPKPKDAQLVGKFHIESNLDKKSIKSNKPVNLTVTIEGEGSLDDFEFPDYEIDNVTIYSDDARVETQIVGGKITSSYVKSFVFISSDSFSIPAKNISTYNVQKDTMENLKVPSYKVEIKAMTPVENIANKSVVHTNLNTVKKEKIARDDSDIKVKSLEWWMLVLAFVLGTLFMYLLRFIPNIFKRKEKPYRESEAIKILYPHISESSDIEKMVRKLYAKKNGDKSVSIDKKELKELIARVRS